MRLWKFILVKACLGGIGALVGLGIGAVAFYFALDAFVQYTVKPENLSVGEGFLVVAGTYMGGLCGGAFGLLAGLTYPLDYKDKTTA